MFPRFFSSRLCSKQFGSEEMNLHWNCGWNMLVSGGSTQRAPFQLCLFSTWPSVSELSWTDHRAEGIHLLHSAEFSQSGWSCRADLWSAQPLSSPTAGLWGNDLLRKPAGSRSGSDVRMKALSGHEPSVLLRGHVKDALKCLLVLECELIYLFF